MYRFKTCCNWKYLSGCDICYQTGSKDLMVFAGKDFLVPYATWVISKNDELPGKSQEAVSYGKPFYLFHKVTEAMLEIDKDFKSPTTKHAEVSISFVGNQVIAINSVNDSDNGYLLSNDIITLKNSENYILRSHEFTFTIDGQTYQEVIGHNEGIDGGNDKWCIELIKGAENERQTK